MGGAATASIDWQGIFDAALGALLKSLSSSLGKDIPSSDISQDTKDEIDATNRDLAVLKNAYSNGDMTVSSYKRQYVVIELHLQAVILKEQILQNIASQKQLQAAESAAFAALEAAAAKMPI